MTTVTKYFRNMWKVERFSLATDQRRSIMEHNIRFRVFKNGVFYCTIDMTIKENIDADSWTATVRRSSISKGAKSRIFQTLRTYRGKTRRSLWTTKNTNSVMYKVRVSLESWLRKHDSLSGWKPPKR